MRVTMGVKNMPIICDMTGTEVRVSTSEVNDLLPNYFLLLSLHLLKNKKKYNVFFKYNSISGIFFRNRF
jgi:hypothetical protein